MEKDSETQIKPFYEFERRNELDSDSVNRGVLLQHKGRLSAIKREGDDAIVIFEGNMTDAKLREISMRLQSQSRLNSKYLLFVPLRRASLDSGMNVRYLFLEELQIS